MSREQEIQRIGKKIQYQINKLKKFNCSIDSRYDSLSIFDNTIEVEKVNDYNDPHAIQQVFDFDTSIRN